MKEWKKTQKKYMKKTEKDEIEGLKEEGKARYITGVKNEKRKKRREGRKCETNRRDRGRQNKGMRKEGKVGHEKTRQRWRERKKGREGKLTIPGNETAEKKCGIYAKMKWRQTI